MPIEAMIIVTYDERLDCQNAAVEFASPPETICP